MNETEVKQFFSDSQIRLNEFGEIVTPYPEIKTDEEIDQLLHNSGLFYVSVDVETDGPVPGRDYSGYSMLQLGCVGIKYANISKCPIFNTRIKPLSMLHDKGALKFLNLQLNSIHADTSRVPPLDAMLNLIHWIKKESDQKIPILVTDNPAFDPVFVKYYLELLGSLDIREGKLARDLFSRRVLDLVGVTMGLYGSMRAKGRVFRQVAHTHDAVEDAKGNAYWFISLIKQGFQIV